MLDAALAELSLDPAVLDEVVPVALPSLAPTVSGLAGRIAALERAATTDDVTGLLTRAAWMSAVREQLQGGQSGIVLVADIEGLAALDERHGYASGNLVLCELARILGRRGTAGRLGGDALALWAAVPAAEADALAAAVRNDVHTRFSADGVTVDVALGSAPAARRRRRGAAARRRSRARAGPRRGPRAPRRLGTLGLAHRLALGRVRRTARRARMPVGQPAVLAQAHRAGLGVAQRQPVAARAGRRRSGRIVVVAGPPAAPVGPVVVVEEQRPHQGGHADHVHEHGEREGQHLLRHARTYPSSDLATPGAQSRAQSAPSSSRSRASASTASAAWRPESRLPPPERSSACSIVSTVSTPNAHGTPVVSWTSWMPRAASAQTQS